MTRHQNAGKNNNIKIANRSFKNLAKFTYLGTTVTNLNLIHEEIKSRLNSGNHSVQNLLSSRLVSKGVNIKIYNAIMFPVVLYGSETWSPVLREEHRQKVFENMVLRRMFGLKRDEIIGCRKWQNEELQNLYSSPNIFRTSKSRRVRLAGHVVRTEENRNAYTVVVGKPEGKRPLGRPKHRW
jgi:hypothetical protein